MSVKLADAAGISYSEIATKAYESGRTELAIKVHACTDHVLIKTELLLTDIMGCQSVCVDLCLSVVGV